MNVSFGFVRVILTFIGAGCAFLLGRSIAGYRRGSVRKSTLWGWAVRASACLIAVAFRFRLDAIDTAAAVLAAAAVAAGWRNASRAKQEEDLTHVIFPGGQ